MMIGTSAPSSCVGWRGRLRDALPEAVSGLVDQDWSTSGSETGKKRMAYLGGPLESNHSSGFPLGSQGGRLRETCETT